MKVGSAQALGARPASGLRSAGRAPPAAADGQQLARPPSAGFGKPGSTSSNSRDSGGFTNILRDSPGARSGRRAVPLLGGADSSDDEDAPVQDLLADPLTGLSMGVQGVDAAAAAAASAQGVLVKDILSAEEELRVRHGNLAVTLCIHILGKTAGLCMYQLHVWAGAGCSCLVCCMGAAGLFLLLSRTLAAARPAFHTSGPPMRVHVDSAFDLAGFLLQRAGADAAAAAGDQEDGSTGTGCYITRTTANGLVCLRSAACRCGLA